MAILSKVFKLQLKDARSLNFADKHSNFSLYGRKAIELNKQAQQ